MARSKATSKLQASTEAAASAASPPAAPAPTTTAGPSTAPAKPQSSPTKQTGKQRNRSKGTAAAGAAPPTPTPKARHGAAPLASTSAASSNTLPWSAVINADVGNQPVVFSSDGDFYFTTSGSSIRIHSRQTGLVVSTLSSASSGPTRHTAPVSALFINPSNPLQLVTASLDGTVKVWDYLDARLLKSLFIGLPIQYAAMHPSHKDRIFLSVRKPKSQPNGEHVDAFNYDGRVNSIIYAVSLSTAASNSRGASNPHLIKPKDLIRVGKTRDASGLEISPDGRWMVLIGNRKVQIASLSSTGIKQGFTKFTTDAPLTAVAFHPDPDNGTFATGDAEGKIRVWYFLRGEDGSGLDKIRMEGAGSEKRAPSTLLHWHAHAVSSLRFSPLGSHLLSGGEEGVLVLWQLATQSKEFVPRLGAPIASIAIAGGTESSDGELVVRLADGSTSFISAASLKVTKSFSGSKIDVTRRQLNPKLLWKVEQPLAVQPATGHLVVTSSHPSTLQFVDVAADRLVREVEVTPSNRVSRPDETPIEPTRVEKVDFFANARGTAEWMVTLDSRRTTSSQGGQEVSQQLKFWKWEGKTERYVLNTRVESPHGSSAVAAMRFSTRAVNLPTSGAGGEAIVSPLLLTAGLDGQVKVWRLATSSIKGGRTSSFWIVRSSFGYRDSIPSDVAWAEDSSLFAVAQGTFVTVWDTRSNVLRRLVCAPSTATPRTGNAAEDSSNTPHESRHIVFAGRGGRYLFMSSSKALSVWDLVLGQMVWERPSTTADSNVRNSRLVKLGEDVVVVSTLERKRVFGSTEGQKMSASVRRSQEAKRSVVQLFDPAMPTPKRSWEVPLAIKEVRAVTSRRGDGEGQPTLLAITEAHDVILLGRGLGEEGSTQSRKAGEQAQSLSGVSIARRTLFDDLFGPSDASAAAAAGEGEKERSTATAAGAGGFEKGLLGLFDAPSHLLPPLESLFGEFVHGILPRRRDVVVPVSSSDAMAKAEQGEEQQREEKEEPEAKDEKQREKEVSALQSVARWDMEDLVGLFMRARIDGGKMTGAGGKAGKAANGATTPVKPPNANATSVPAGSKKDRATPKSGTPSSTPKLNGAAGAAGKGTPSSSSTPKQTSKQKESGDGNGNGNGKSPTAGAGRKRKSLPT